MSKIRFSKEDIEKLKDNPYILNISEKAITYTDEFKESFLNYIIKVKCQLKYLDYVKYILKLLVKKE